ncbi:MAG: PIN domain-containing protein [bacterium]|nr:PIN domain-containing protein [bacterium]
MNILIDTSILIEHLRTYIPGKKTILAGYIEKQYNLYFSLITVGEIYSGKSSPEHEEEIVKLFDMSSMTAIDYELLKSAGEIRRMTHISLIDAIVATTALALDIPVATLNIKDFEKVEGLKFIH